jgi:hypothetical protein
MKKLLSVLLLVTAIAFSQQPYYNDVNLTLTGEALYNELQMKIAQHNQTFTYGDARDVLVFTDEDPDNTANVLLVYGYNDNDGNCTTDRSRDKNDFGGLNCEYNREHVFARSNSTPPMPFNGTNNNTSTGIVADPHNIRACDVQMNNLKGNRLLAAGSGNAGLVGQNYYPGDEWKGDVARMMMYMYTRYGDQCLPSLNGFGTLQSGTQMLQLYLQWNVDDPVNDIEDHRNDFLEGVYGNRNPFIDNPALATIIWGGPVAEDRWGILSSQNFTLENLTIFPNPAKNNSVTVSSSSEFNSISIYDINGRVINKYNNLNTSKHIIELDKYRSGFYLVQIQSGNQSTTKKLLVL